MFNFVSFKKLVIWAKNKLAFFLNSSDGIASKYKAYSILLISWLTWTKFRPLAKYLCSFSKVYYSIFKLLIISLGIKIGGIFGSEKYL